MVPLRDYMRLALQRLSDGHENLGMIPSQHLLWVLGLLEVSSLEPWSLGKLSQGRCSVSVSVFSFEGPI